MDQINKISKMCDANVRFTWPGFSEAAESEKCSKLKKKGKQEEEEKPPSPPPHAGNKDTQDEEGNNKKTKLECEACTRGPGPGPAARGNVRRSVLWCCTRCVLMCCGAMRMFVAAAGVLGLCLTMFLMFAPSEDAKP